MILNFQYLSKLKQSSHNGKYFLLLNKTRLFTISKSAAWPSAPAAVIVLVAGTPGVRPRLFRFLPLISPSSTNKNKEIKNRNLQYFFVYWFKSFSSKFSSKNIFPLCSFVHFEASCEKTFYESKLFTHQGTKNTKLHEVFFSKKLEKTYFRVAGIPAYYLEDFMELLTYTLPPFPVTGPLKLQLSKVAMPLK